MGWIYYRWPEKEQTAEEAGIITGVLSVQLDETSLEAAGHFTWCIELSVGAGYTQKCTGDSMKFIISHFECGNSKCDHINDAFTELQNGGVMAMFS